MTLKIDVLDYGYVELIEASGHGHAGVRHDQVVVDFETGIIEAARQSTQGSFRGWDDDSKLLRYLYQHEHYTPFEFASMTVEVQAPIFVFREWHRHRTQSYNEMSARYAPLPDLYFMPEADNVKERGRFAAAAGTRQATGVGAFDEQYVQGWLDAVQSVYGMVEALYQQALQHGIPKELARITMPVGHYTRMRASANLRNWLQFLSLRDSTLAQWEIRRYAKAVGQCVAHCFPRTWALFEEAPR